MNIEEHLRDEAPPTLAHNDGGDLGDKVCDGALPASGAGLGAMKIEEHLCDETPPTLAHNDGGDLEDKLCDDTLPAIGAGG